MTGGLYFDGAGGFEAGADLSYEVSGFGESFMGGAAFAASGEEAFGLFWSGCGFVAVIPFFMVSFFSSTVFTKLYSIFLTTEEEDFFADPIF